MFLDIGGGARGLMRAIRQMISGRGLAFAAIASAFLFLFLGSVTLALSVGDLDRGFEQVRYTEQILRLASQLGTEIGSAEAAGRGYMLASEAVYLDRLNRARRAISRELRTLRTLSAGNPAQVARLGVMDRDLTSHLGAYDTPLAPGDAQLAKLLSDLRSGVLRMDPKLEAAFSELRAAEFAALRRRQALAAQQATLSLGVSVLTLIFGLLSGAAGLYFIARERAHNDVRKVREEFAHVSRLNMMGEVAATLAHEVKQPLTASSNYLSVAKRQLANDGIGRDKVAETMDKISAQVGRAADIIQHLRTHVSRAGEAATKVDVEGTIKGAIALSGIERSDLVIHTEFDERLPPVCVDRVQIQQVLVNLMRNAVEAMAESPRKTILVAARRTEHRMVRVEVRDSGPGLPQEIRENLFKPFVTTKEGGMGVGLSICRSIVQAHGGNIVAEAAPDGGTVFVFTVPQA